MVTDDLTELVRSALDAAAADGIVPAGALPSVEFERPKRREHGDWSSNAALAAARAAGKPPREIAAALLERMPDSPLVEAVEIAGPGFLNFRLSPAWLHDVVRRAARPGSGFGRFDQGKGKKINLEYVSANPTGPVNVVSGRHAAAGDTLGNLFETMGYAVTREFYANDAGRQIRLFAESVAARYLEHFGVTAEIPNEGYKGDYIVDIARTIADDVGDRLVRVPEEERVEAIGETAVELMIDQVKRSLARYGTEFDVWFRESQLHDSGDLEAGLEKLKASGYVDERDGALWFRSSELGDDKDRVLVRASGEPTYLAADVAYMLNKLSRGYDQLIYFLGPDHHGTVRRFLALADALGAGRDVVRVLLSGYVTITRGGQAVRSSKREGQLVTLDELVDEVGRDAARYTFQARSLEAPLEFDIDLATQQAPENPVYYVQYAHARISAIARKAEEQGVKGDADGADLTLLTHPSEDALLRKLATFEEVIPGAAHARAPQRIARYAEELAGVFSAFYRDCRVVSEDVGLSAARLALCVATKAVLADGLRILGVTAPERM